MKHMWKAKDSTRQSDGIKNEAAVQEINIETGGALNSADAAEAADKDSKESEGNKDSEGNVQTDTQLDAIKEVEDELEKSEELKKSNVAMLFPPQEECPICLEEYDAENPKMSTKCEHHFHLSCILEWMERSDTCPKSVIRKRFNPAKVMNSNENSAYRRLVTQVTFVVCQEVLFNAVSMSLQL
ncbi:hypothetical protein HAX54_011688 [Datura stramonium]|uniref:RING-type E3 ubiquitin transferase n=1 Tax=Datura stramonium TaxID=4076 RepID=A0ABS8TKG1_DATST|nr:hypothetical protein [Datura stramonium]